MKLAPINKIIQEISWYKYNQNILKWESVNLIIVTISRSQLYILIDACG